MDVEKLVPEAGDLAGFIKQFGVFASAPGGVNQLRNLIIQLGIKGLLVKQLLRDGRASLELESILAIKADLIKKKLFKRTPKLEKLEIDVDPYELPSSWVWTTLATIGQINPRNNVDDDIECSFIPMPSISQIYNGALLKEARQWKDIKSGFTHFAENDIALAKITPCFQNSKAAIMRGLHNGFGAGTTELHVFRPINNTILSEYVYLYLKSPKFIQDGILKMTGSAGQKRVPVYYFAGTPFPLPPLEEQKRIVAKVDELMALCDKLEAQQQQQANNVLRANTAAINALLNPEPQQTAKNQKTSATVSASEPKASFEQNWQRITQHFNTLYGCTLPMPKGEGRKKKHLVGLENVRGLRKIILQVAVMGKLVPQGKNEETASALLEKISADKKKLVNSGEIKKVKLLPSIRNDEKPFTLPVGWEWCRIWDIAKLITSGSRGWAKYYSDKGAIFVTMGNLSRGSYRLRLDSIKYVRVPGKGEGLRTKLEENDLLISITGDVGNLGLIPKDFGEAYINQHTCLLRFMPICQSRYFAEVMRSPCAIYQFNAPQRGIKNSFRLGDVGEILIPLPPLEEQKHIVAKVDQLMILCDQLEQQLTQSYSDAEKLMQATVKALVA